MYQIKTSQFTGPIETLLEMIEGRKLEITQVSLALVTDDFLKFVQEMNATGKERNEEEIRFLSDFVAIASRLLLIKSKALLPSLELSNEDQEDIKDLEQRLKFYQQFKPAMVHIKELYEREAVAVSRPLLLGRPTIFYPAPEITSRSLHEAMRNLFETIRAASLDLKKVEHTVVRLEEKIEEILSKVTSGIRSFGALINEKSKKEVVVLFLALLHLLRDQHIHVDQSDRFGDISIKKSSRE
ncbi:MAG: Chromosome segregation and condensation protein ScpA [Candidatus Wolfebacteria bacterium GW2011_GWC2_46_275]|uniref:Segregation and condensation protein A n=2 Tax=Candidatus Wolfeibacteriota TaxID=1752735 RepID=A0A0G1U888_9BACT|nr:MAG: chromosome segregation and condensation protein ScpA, segregation and condensation protein A [Candidatus Wolfebacteria bacterium GW2011_GWB1_47_1]KKU37134.1 MAG: Chromosome segregation and condensation protein ScpA [Candidatus Wolfebacteria bacterium GW2011_GWC2_46_275]KKU42706.1 MAG: Chromosome segregation and condensation protein ScpA [Candidatus Wolfebacteria bacterium GW2011_GWB2_46_69]KKU54559.1 MAG: Chromosome segregation and condensation protein ScpA [Candidatus Wolfebacteria bact